MRDEGPVPAARIRFPISKHRAAVSVTAACLIPSCAHLNLVAAASLMSVATLPNVTAYRLTFLCAIAAAISANAASRIR
jgi:hypothetical protein